MDAKKIAEEIREQVELIDMNSVNAQAELVRLANELEKLATTPEPKPVHRIRNRYRIEGSYCEPDGNEHILAQVGYQSKRATAALISLVTGKARTDPVSIGNVQAITDEEFKDICGYSGAKFTLIEQAGEGDV